MASTSATAAASASALGALAEAAQAQAPVMASRLRSAGSPAALSFAPTPGPRGSAPRASSYGGGAASSAGASPSGGPAGASPSGGPGGKHGQWVKPPPPHRPGGGGASLAVTAGPRVFARVLHRCKQCNVEFDGSAHLRGSKSGEEKVWWGKTVFCSSACAESAAEAQTGEPVKVPVSPRLPRPPPAASGSDLDEATQLEMDQHRARYVACDRAIRKAAETCGKHGAIFAGASRLPPPRLGAGLQVASAATLGVTPEGSPDLLAAALCAISVASSVPLRGQLKAAIQSVVGGPQARSSALVQPEGAAAYVAGLSADAKLALRAALEADQAAGEASAAVVEAETRRAVPPALLAGDFGASLLRLDASFKKEFEGAAAVRERLCQVVCEWDAEVVVPAIDRSAARQRAVDLIKDFDSQSALVRAKYDAWLNWSARKPRPSQRDAVVELWVATSAAQALCREFVKGAGSVLPGSPKAAAAKGKVARGGKRREAAAEAEGEGDQRAGGGEGGGGKVEEGRGGPAREPSGGLSRKRARERGGVLGAPQRPAPAAASESSSSASDSEATDSSSSSGGRCPSCKQRCGNTSLDPKKCEKAFVRRGKGGRGKRRK